MREVREYMDNHNIGWCIEAHDLAASKLMAFREKDTEFVRRLIIEKMIDPIVLIERINKIDTHTDLKERALRWAKAIAEELKK